MKKKMKKPAVFVDEIEDREEAPVGQGFNNARGDSFRQRADIPKHNGQNVHNDPTINRPEKTRPDNPR